jgi:rod shape-determining protein MreC
VDRSPPPFFKQGPSATARLVFFSLLAMALLIGDARYGLLNAIRIGVSTVLYPVQRTALIPRDAIHLFGGYFSELDQLKLDNTNLKRTEISNSKVLQQAAQLANENVQLRKLLEARERSEVKSMLAEVLYESRDPNSRRIVLDKGMQQGLALGQPVIDTQGVIGQITRVFLWTAEVSLVTDRELTLPVQIARSGARAIAYGTPRGLELRYLSSNSDIEIGDQIITSGLDGIYPIGLAVGKVIEVDRAGTNSFPRAMIQPAAGVNTSQQVLVLLVDRSKLPPPPAPEEPSGKRKARRAG